MPSKISSSDSADGVRLLKESALYAMAKGIPGVLGLLSVVVFIRLVGAEQFGFFAILTATASMWSSFAGGWLFQGILRYYSSWRTTPADLFQLLRTGIGLSATACAAVLLLSLLWLDTPVQPMDLVLCLALAILMIVQTVALSLWQSDLRPNTVLRVELLRTTVAFCGSCLLAWLVSPNARALVGGAAIGYAASFIVGRLPTRAFREGNGAVPPNLRKIWSYGWPLSFWFLVQLSFPWLDRVMIAGRFGLHDTGVFASLSEVLTRSFSLLVYPLTMAAHPRLASLWNNGEQEAARRMLRIALVSSIGISVAAVLALHLCRKWLVLWLLPATARDLPALHPELIALLAAGGAIWQIALIVHKPLELHERTRTMLIAIGGAFAIKLLTNYYGIQQWGVPGAVYGTIAAGLMYCVGCTLASSTDRKR